MDILLFKLKFIRLSVKSVKAKLLYGFYPGVLFIVLSGFAGASELYAQNKESIIVMPFKNATGEKGLDYFSNDLVKQFNYDLREYGKLRLINSTGNMKFIKQIKPSRSGSTVNEQNIEEAYAVKANYILSGTYSGKPSSMRLRIIVVDVNNGKVLISRSAKGSTRLLPSKIVSHVLKISDKLVKVPSGFLSVYCLPSSSSVYVDDEFKGYTPLVRHKLPAGDHQIRISKKGYHSLEFKVTVKSGQTKTISDALDNEVYRGRWGLGVAAYGLWVPHEEFSLAPLFSLLFHSSFNQRLITIDFSYVHTLGHAYEYDVPYSTQKDDRFYRVMHAGFSIYHLFIGKSKTSQPYIGGRLGVLMFTDYRKTSDADVEIDSNSIITVGPAIGISLTPNRRVRYFFEVRYTFPVIEVSRQKIRSVNIVGNQDIYNDVMYMHMLSLGGGISVQF